MLFYQYKDLIIGKYDSLFKQVPSVILGESEIFIKIVIKAIFWVELDNSNSKFLKKI